MADAAAHDDATLAFYDAEAPAYVATGGDAPNRDLAGFLDRLPHAARILELGCGSGRDAAAMLARGFAVDPTDGSPAMARAAEARIRCPVRVMRFDALDADCRYDGVWAHASLLHVPRAALPGVLARIHRALRPGGLHFASYKGGSSEGRDALGRYYNYPSPDELHDLYRAAGSWSALDIASGKGRGYDKRVTPWHAVWAVRR